MSDFSLVTVVLIVVPSAKFAYRSAGSHTMIETATAMIALIAALLVYGRFKNSGSLCDLLLLVGLWFFSAPKFIVPFIQHSVAAAPERFSAWAMLVASVIGSGLFAVAAFLRDQRLRRSTQALAIAGAAAVLCAVVVGALLAHVSPNLQLGLDPVVSSAMYPEFGAPSIVIVQGVALLLFGAAAIGFMRRAEWSGDEFMSWLSASAALASFARLNYVFFPSLHHEWVYPADLLRLGAYLMILAGAAREIRRYQLEISRGAVFEERRRMARELHDGLAQELSYLVTKSRDLAENVIEPTAQELRRLAGAAERALDESRRAITALTAPIDESLENALSQTVEQVANRVGTRAEVIVEGDVKVPVSTKEALIRIVREAVTNASRHGNARNVHVAVTNGALLRVTIRDDGSGFDPTTRDGDGGFGMTTMAERVHALGGELRVSSRPAAGTEVEVTIP